MMIRLHSRNFKMVSSNLKLCLRKRLVSRTWFMMLLWEFNRERKILRIGTQLRNSFRFICMNALFHTSRKRRIWNTSMLCSPSHLMSLRTLRAARILGMSFMRSLRMFRKKEFEQVTLKLDSLISSQNMRNICRRRSNTHTRIPYWILKKSIKSIVKLIYD
jgi:hypothetical protein